MSDRISFPEGSVEDTLASIGVEVLREDADELVALCPGHKERTGKEDGHPSWSINARSGVHFCFSCQYKGTLFSLVRDLKGSDAARDLYEPFERYGRLVLPEGEEGFEVGEINPKPAETIRTPNIKPESWLDQFVDPPKWARDARKVSLAACWEYEVRWDKDRDAWVLPLRDPETKKLYGYQAKSEKTRFFRNRPRSMQKSHTFFGWPAIDLSSPTKLLVVESPLDAVLLSDYGMPAVASCGSRLSDEQIDLLRLVDSVHLWLDNDTAGELEVKRLRKVMVASGIRAEFITPEDHPEWRESGWKDVGEMPDDAVANILDASGL
jgi:hypothetical protein